MGNPVPFPDQEFKLVFSLPAPPFFSPLELARDPGILFPPPRWEIGMPPSESGKQCAWLDHIAPFETKFEECIFPFRSRPMFLVFPDTKKIFFLFSNSFLLFFREGIRLLWHPHLVFPSSDFKTLPHLSLPFPLCLFLLFPFFLS